MQSVEVPNNHSRCSRAANRPGWCKRVFPIEYVNGRALKYCPKCREVGKRAAKKYQSSDSGRSYKKLYENSESGKAAGKRYRTSTHGHAKRTEQMEKWRATDNGKEMERKWRQSDQGKAVKAKAIAKWRATDNGKEMERKWRQSEAGKLSRQKTNKKRDGNMLYWLHRRIWFMLHTVGYESTSLLQYTQLPCQSALRKHFESTMDKTWMTWQNHGGYRKGMPYKTVWQIGHRIPLAAYNPEVPEDVRRCHSIDNMFCQDGRENSELNAKIPDEHVLSKLKHVWPTAWA